MKQPKYKATLYILLFLILSSMLVAMASCNTIKKAFNRQKTAIDSTYKSATDSMAVRTTDSTTIHKVDSVGKKRTKAEGERVIEIEMQDGGIISNSATTGDYTVFRPVVSGKVKRITITEKGTFKTSETVGKSILDSTGRKTFDTTQKSSNDNGQLKKKETVSSKDVSKKKMPFLLIAGFVVIIGLVVLFLLYLVRKKIPF